MPEFQGLCGRFTITPCRLVWNSRYSNRIGSYPADLLPSTRTVWHAAANGSYNFRPPLIGPGDNFGLPFGGFIGGFFNFAPPQNDIFTPQSHFVISFIKTANRIDAIHRITQSEIETLGTPGLAAGEIRITINDFILDVIAVLDDKKVVETIAAKDGKLTPAELEDIENTGENLEDRIFRKLFTLNYPNNRLITVEQNRIAIEYRLDNGDPKVIAALKLAGTGDINSASYRDGTSRNIIIKSTVNNKVLKAGDIVYISYTAAVKHYLRQSVEISWTIQALAIPPQCFSFPSKVKVSSYRFFEWETKSDDPQGLPVKLNGWRVVETFNIPVNFTVATRKGENANLGDFIMATPGGATIQTKYMPVRSTPSQIQEYINNRQSMPSYNVEQNADISGSRYHINSGSQNNSTAFRQSQWWTRGNFNFFSGYEEATRHILFNVHKKALEKRDADKFGIDRSMAEQIVQDINAGNMTFFPFMDDPLVANPTLGVNEFLDSTNTEFNPIQPVSGYSVANAEISCGVGGAIQLGYTGSSDDVIAAINFNSNFITEKFEKDTKIIVERHFTAGQVDGRFVAMQGVGTTGNSLTCIGDPSKTYSFVAHCNSDNLLVLNSFKMGLVNKGLKDLIFSPDVAPIDFSDVNPMPANSEPQLAFTGLLGDKPGFYPGRIINTTSYADISVFSYLTNNPTRLKELIPGINDSQISFVTPIVEDNKIIFPVGVGFYGRTEITYSYTGNPFEAILIFRAGSGIESVVDSITVNSSLGSVVSLSVDHRWMRGDSIELVGSNINNIELHSVYISHLPADNSKDFLTNIVSSNQNDIRALDRLELLHANMFFESDIMSLGEDSQSRLFLFFNDNDGGISCLESNDFGYKWIFHYGIIEKNGNIEARNPFLVHSFETDEAFLFYSFKGKILCKNIKYSLFKFEDAFIIERFLVDVLSADEIPTEKLSLYTESGKKLRQRTLSYLSVGDLSDNEFLGLTGRTISENGQGVYEPFETRKVEIKDDSGQTVAVEQSVRKNMIAIGTNTIGINQDILTEYFSAYKSDRGILRLFFNGQIEDNKNLLQCYFSNDSGISWFYNWEFKQFGMNRVRKDSVSKTMFIDTNANGEITSNIEQTNPRTPNQKYQFGISIHGLLIDGSTIEVESPYVYYQKTFRSVFVFYIYKGCLFCKIFDENIIEDATNFTAMKQMLETKIRSYFIDGNLEDDEIRSQIYGFFDPATKERTKSGNIIFSYQMADSDSSEAGKGFEFFNQDRNISAQRICAYEQPNGSIRVFYKIDGFNNVKASIWSGSAWFVEEFLKDPSKLSNNT